MLSIRYEGNGNTIDLANTPNLVITGHEGLNQPTSETITLSNPYLRGSQYQRSQISDRPISFTFNVFDVENTRHKLMKVFKSGEKGILTLENDYRSGQIDCYLEELTFNKFENPVTCTIFLRAPYPYFKGLEDIIAEIDNTIEMFELEAYIPEEGVVLGEIGNEHSSRVDNTSDINVGISIEIISKTAVANPIIYNGSTNKFIELNYTMSAGEKVTITTGVGNKKITSELNGVTTNIINKLTKGSTFFQLERGINDIKCEAKTLRVVAGAGLPTSNIVAEDTYATQLSTNLYKYIDGSWQQVGTMGSILPVGVYDGTDMTVNITYRNEYEAI